MCLILFISFCSSLYQAPDSVYALHCILPKHCPRILILTTPKTKPNTLHFQLRLPKLLNPTLTTLHSQIPQHPIFKPSRNLPNILTTIFLAYKSTLISLTIIFLRLSFLISNVDIINISIWVQNNTYLFYLTTVLVVIPFVGVLFFISWLL